MNNKKFAIFITSYNYAEYISQAIESVINQTDTNWNLYIIDDNSTDNTYEIVAKYLKKDSRISWKKHDKNIGLVPTLIESFKEIDADYISTLGSDDWLEPNFVENAKKAFSENPDIPFCAFGWKLFLQDKKFFQSWAIPFAETFRGKVFISPYLVFVNFLDLSSIVFNKNKTKNDFFAMLNYLEKVKIRQNLEIFMMKFLEAKYGASYFINGFYIAHRSHSKNLSNTQNKNFQGLFEFFSEPVFYFQNVLQNNSNKNLTANIANKYISLVGLLSRTGIPYRSSAEWILTDLGQPLAENFANINLQFVKENHLEKSLLCLAICVWSAFIFNCNLGGFDDINTAKKQLGDWIIDIQKQYNLRSIKEIYAEANKLYDGYFMPLIK